jgi:single-strand DNA-binding protein
MTSFNKVILIGNLGSMFELRYTGTGVPVASNSLATNSRRKTPDKNWVTDTAWHQIVILKDLALFASEKFTKGQSVMVEGSLKYSHFFNDKGEKVPRTQIVVSSITPFGMQVGKSHLPEKSDQAGESDGTPLPNAPAQEHSDWLAKYDATPLATGFRPRLN